MKIFGIKVWSHFHCSEDLQCTVGRGGVRAGVLKHPQKPKNAIKIAYSLQDFFKILILRRKAKVDPKIEKKTKFKVPIFLNRNVKTWKKCDEVTLWNLIEWFMLFDAIFLSKLQKCTLLYTLSVQLNHEIYPAENQPNPWPPCKCYMLGASPWSLGGVYKHMF